LQGAVLRTVVAVDARQVSRDVARRRFSASRRGRRIIFSAITCRLLVFARLGGLQQRKTKFPISGGGLPSLRRQGWKPAIGRIDNQRRARPDRMQGQTPRDVRVAPPPFPKRCALFVQFGSLCLGEEFLTRIFGRAL